MPVSQSDQGLNSPKHLAIYAKVIGIQVGVLVQKLDYASVKRMVDIPSDSDSENEVEALDDDPLAEILVDGLDELAGWLATQTADDRVDQASEELTARGLTV